MEGWVGLVDWPTADTLPTKWSQVNHRLGVDRGKVRQYRRSNHCATPTTICDCLQSTRRWRVGGRAAISWCATSSGCGHRNTTSNRSPTPAGRRRRRQPTPAPSSKFPPHLPRRWTASCWTRSCSITGWRRTAPTDITSSANKTTLETGHKLCRVARRQCRPVGMVRIQAGKGHGREGRIWQAWGEKQWLKWKIRDWRTVDSGLGHVYDNIIGLIWFIESCSQNPDCYNMPMWLWAALLIVTGPKCQSFSRIRAPQNFCLDMANVLALVLSLAFRNARCLQPAL